MAITLGNLKIEGKLILRVNGEDHELGDVEFTVPLGVQGQVRAGVVEEPLPDRPVF